MYCSHFNLDKKPFQISSDRGFLWLGSHHGHALDLLQRGTDQGGAIMVLTGDIGTGKTTLINEVIHTLGKDRPCVRIEDPGFELHSLYQKIAQTLGFREPDPGEKRFSSRFHGFLDQVAKKGQKVLVVVDESQRIPYRLLREILSWPKIDSAGVLSVILAGQLDFLDVLTDCMGRAWTDLVQVHVRLDPLDLNQTRAYIGRRLAIAGADHTIFTNRAVEEVFGYAKGIPRVINICCDQALIQAFSDDQKRVDRSVVQGAVAALELPGAHSADQKEMPGKQIAGAVPGNEKGPSPLLTRRVNEAFALLAGLGICILVGYGIFSTLTPRKDPDAIREGKAEHLVMPEVREPIKPPGLPILSPQGQVNREKGGQAPGPVLPSPNMDPSMGLGYTPGPEHIETDKTPGEKDPMPSPMPVLVSSGSPDSGEEKAFSDMNSFIQKVFLSKDKQSALMKAQVQSPEPEKEDRQAVGEPGRKPIPSHPEALPDRSGDIRPERVAEPEPAAVIDWLIRKRAGGG